jgi:hypothetical protein
MGISVNSGPTSLTFGQAPTGKAGSNTITGSQKGSGQPCLGNLGADTPGPGDASGGSEEAGSSRFQMRPPIPFVDEKAKRPTPLPLIRMLGSKDYKITIECFTDSVTIYPGGKSFNVADLPTVADLHCPLVQTVQALIARRQSAVREGEAPYRPILHFQVHPDGRRSYFAAWPLLEALKLPMSREDVD